MTDSSRTNGSAIVEQSHQGVPHQGVQGRTPTNSGPLVPSGFVINRVLGVDELAIFFGCSTEKIKRQARKGELPAFKFGKSWYVREQDLWSYIERAVAMGADPRH